MNCSLHSQFDFKTNFFKEAHETINYWKTDMKVTSIASQESLALLKAPTRFSCSIYAISRKSTLWLGERYWKWKVITVGLVQNKEIHESLAKSYTAFNILSVLFCISRFCHTYPYFDLYSQNLLYVYVALFHTCTYSCQWRNF